MHLLRKAFVLTALFLCSSSLSGCAGVAFIGRPVMGATALYASTSSTEFLNEQTKLGLKKGEGCVTSILGFVTLGDVSVNEITFVAEIRRVTHIDHKFENILGVYAKYCIHVYGD